MSIFDSWISESARHGGFIDATELTPVSPVDLVLSGN